MKVKIFFSILIVLLIIQTFNYQNKNSSFNSELFSVDDTTLISKILIADRYGNIINLSRDKKKWIVNKNFNARNDAVNNLLTTIKNIRIKNKIDEKVDSTISKQISSLGVGVEIYNKKNKVIKSFIVGPTTKDYLGTYIYHLKTKKSYSCYIPGFNGFLSPSFGIQANRVNVKNWRDPLLISKNKNQIDSIISINLINSKQSFKLINNKNLDLIDLSTNSVIENDKISSKQFINSFSNLNVEQFLDDSLKLKLTSPIKSLKIYHSGKVDSILFYSIIGANDSNNYKIKKKYAIKNSSEVSLVQDYVFNKVLININELK